MTVTSGGIIPLFRDGEEWKVLLLRYYSYWDFPKGKTEPGESLLQAAIRETKEEASLDSLTFRWGTDSCSTRPYSRPRKIATYFVAQSGTDNFKLLPNPITGRVEHHEARWVTFEQAKVLLGDRLKPILDWAVSKIKTPVKVKAKDAQSTNRVESRPAKIRPKSR